MPESFDTITYIDGHGVHWAIIKAGTGGIFATPDTTGARRYDPTPGDVGPVPNTPGNPDMARQHLEDQIEAAVKDLTPTLVVTAVPDAGVPWWVWGLVGLALLSTRRR